MTGAYIETGKRVWDPWGLSNWVPPSYARECELANGRSAMLATVGWVWPKWFGTFESQDVTTTDPIGEGQRSRQASSAMPSNYIFSLKFARHPRRRHHAGRPPMVGAVHPILWRHRGQQVLVCSEWQGLPR